MITTYHRPQSLDEAVTLLADRGAVPLGGGTTLTVTRTETPLEVVDLQALDLGGVAVDGSVVRIGSMTTLQELADSDRAPQVIRDTAGREAPRTLRNSATVGGTVVTADPESELVAALLAFGARVGTVRADGPSELGIDDLLGDPGLPSGSIVTHLTVRTGGRAAADRTGRTPMDRPIVAVVAHRSPEGTRIAATGVAPHPVLIEQETVDDLDPPSDFRGSAEYRRHLAAVLTDRALARLEAVR